MIPRYNSWRWDWEKPYLAGTEAGLFKNTLKDVADILRACSGSGTRFELECYDIGHLYTAAHFLDRGLIEPPLFIQSVFGIRGGIGPHPEDVLHMKRTADRLFGSEYQWSVVGAGRHQMFVAVQSAVLGGNVRVGLEDSLWIGKGQLAHPTRIRWPKCAAFLRSSDSKWPRRPIRVASSDSRGKTTLPSSFDPFARDLGVRTCSLNGVPSL
jgi:uncharacterized protein (DUF849 family)